MASKTESGDGLTTKGYWAELEAVGIQRMRRVTELNWLARDREGMMFPVRDPEDLTPEQRRAVLDDLLFTHVGRRQ